MNVTVTTDLGVLQIEDAQPAQVDRLLNYVSLHLASQEDTVEVELDVPDRCVKGFFWPKCWSEHVKAVAKDQNGRWYAYLDGIPTKTNSKWFIDNGIYVELNKQVFEFPETAWTHSLIINPYIDHEESQDAS